ncbi:MAG: hypothetical protein ABSF65_09580 [Candidatus Bathyarchaeia archaeon]|jgi:hypothetical protein
MSQPAADPSSVSKKQPKATSLKLRTQQLILLNTLSNKISKAESTEILMNRTKKEQKMELIVLSA